MKKVGKTTSPFRHDLNQIPYDYVIEVTNRFRRLDLIDRVPEDLWTEVHAIVQEAGIKIIPKEKKMKKAKWLSEEALETAIKRREGKGKGENFGLRPQGPCRVGTGESGLVLSEEGNPAGLSSCSGGLTKK